MTHWTSRAASLALRGTAHVRHSSALSKAFSDCEAIVERHDRENFEWIRSLNVEYRAPILVLRALNAETSIIGDLVTQGGPALRQMRFEWWRGAVDDAYAGTKVEHPVIIALQHCLQLRTLSKYHFHRLITAKEADQVEHKSPATLEDLETFAESTSSQLQYLQLQAVGVRNGQADHAASHLGKAVGIASVLRGSAMLLSKGVNYLPLDLCAQHGVSAECLFRGQDSPGLREVVFKVATLAKQHLDDARQLHGKGDAVPADARKVFLSSIACSLFLEALERCEFNVLDQRLRSGGFTPLWYTIQWRLAQFRNQY